MFKRKLVSQLAERLNEPRRFIQIVVGPRQTGKTTAISQALEEVNTATHFVSADDPGFVSNEWLWNEWEQARALTKTANAVLVIDEIQKVGKWLSIVKLLWDEDSRLCG